MKLTAVAVSLVCLVGATVAHAQGSASSAEREIQPLVDDELAAANAHDTDRFLTAYLHDSTLVQIFNGTITRGFTAVREQQLKAWSNGAGGAVYSFKGPIDYRELAHGVVVATMELATHRTLPTGEQREMDITVSTIWQKRPEGWRAVYVHESTPR